MAAIIWTNVVDHAPELANMSTGAKADILDYVNTVIAIDLFDGENGPTTKLARIFLAAHIATVDKSRGTGTVTSETAGRLTRMYSITPGNLRFDWDRSSYGRAFASLVNRSAARVPFVP